MIAIPAWPGAACSDAADGDVRNDPRAREWLSAALGIPAEWATCRQVHGTTVRAVVEPGPQGDGDAMWTDRPGVPIAVFTADCHGVVLESDHAAGVAHSGWRGAAEGVVAALRREMAAAGHEPRRALIAPGIGPCCFEVGDEVADRFHGHVGRTTWGTTSVDLAAAIRGQLAGMDVESTGFCTRHDDRFFSHRRDRTPRRQAVVTWVR